MSDDHVATFHKELGADRIFAEEFRVLHHNHNGAGFILKGEVLVAVLFFVGGGYDAANHRAVGYLNIAVGVVHRVERQQFRYRHVRLLVECEGWRKIFFFRASRKKRECKQNYNGKEERFFHRMIFKDWNCKNSTFFAILHFSISRPVLPCHRTLQQRRVHGRHRAFQNHRKSTAPATWAN